MTELISQDLASKLCGVSEKTLQRFAEAGYLRAETRDHKLFFSALELRSTFGVSVISTSPQELQSEPLAQTLEEPLPPIEPEETPVKPPLPSGNHIPEPIVNEEVTRLTQISALQEKLLELREAELSELRAERDWLRERIEKLEGKNDRDQLILASLTQTNRGLISLVEKRRSPVRAALEWFGVVPTTHSDNGGDTHDKSKF